MSPSVYITPHLYFTQTSGCRPPSDRVFVILSFRSISIFFFFFYSLCVLLESKEMRYICKKKKFSSLKFKICKIFTVTIDGIIKNCRKSKQKKNSRAKSLKFSNYLKSRLTRNYYKFRIIYRNNGSRIGLNTNMFNLSPSIPFSTLLTL